MSRVRRTWKKILFGEALAAEGLVVFAKACDLGLEGIASSGREPLQERGKPQLTQYQ
jgi:hypothetical protein